MFYDFIYLAKGFRMRPKVRSTLKTVAFSCLNTGKTSAKITLTCRLHAASRYARSSDIRTVDNNIKDHKTFNASDVIHDSTRTERPRVTKHGRDRHSVTSHLRDRLVLVVVTARNTHGTHNYSATGPFSETGMCCGG